MLCQFCIRVTHLNLHNEQFVRECQPSSLCCCVGRTATKPPQARKMPALPLQLVITQSCHSVLGSQETSPHHFPKNTGLCRFFKRYSAFGLCNNKWLAGWSRRQQALVCPGSAGIQTLPCFLCSAYLCSSNNSNRAISRKLRTARFRPVGAGGWSVWTLWDKMYVLCCT